MRLTDTLAELRDFNQPVLQTADVSARLNIAGNHASKLMARLADSGHVMRIKRGLWIFPDKADPLSLPAYLTAPFPSYISLQTALYHRGMVSQIPGVVYAISVARTRSYATPLGTFSIHHVCPSFYFGYETADGSGVRMATPEKALIDVLYLMPARSRLFRALPEVEIPRGFSRKKARAMIRRVTSAGRRTMLENRFSRLLETSAQENPFTESVGGV